MPHRLVSIAILIFWSIAAVALFTRDLLPDLIVGPPPDLRSIARAEDGPVKSNWAVLVADDRADQAQLRAVGHAETRTERKNDGWVQFSSEVGFDSGEVLRGTPFRLERGERMAVKSTIEVDPAGNLQHFHSSIHPAGGTASAPLLILEGWLENDALKVQARGPVKELCWTQRFPYRARGVVHNTLGPVDRLPGLQVGQRWESQVINPLTNQVATAHVEVTGREYRHWGKGPVEMLVVTTRVPPLTARTWVRADGLVLRQEVPLFFLKLVLERLPESESGVGAAPGPEDPRP